MRQFNVRIKEILVKTVTVEAENPTQAKKVGRHLLSPLGLPLEPDHG